jgi:SET domain-containing protein
LKPTRDGRINIVALKNINKNEEIFIAYGREYWNDHDRFNRDMRKAIAQSLDDQRQLNNNRNIIINDNNNNQRRCQPKKQSKRISAYTIRILTPITKYTSSGR